MVKTVEIKVELDADEIVPRIWQGARPPRGDTLASEGFHLLVLCASEYQTPSAFYRGIDVHWAPNEDDTSVPFGDDQLAVAWDAARVVAAAYREGKTSMVTCFAGINRSGLVVALALHEIFGWSGERCIEAVRMGRKPKEYNWPKPLTNAHFVAALHQIKEREPSASSS